MSTALPPGYSVRFADSGHNPIRSWEDFRAVCGEAVLGLYLGKDLIGTGELAYMRGQHGRKNVHTDAMALRKKWRRKGHGIVLYLAVILAAKRLGVDTIYSSRWLNRFSQKMWRVKLAALFNVKRVGGCRACQKEAKYFIRLKEKK